MRPTQMAQIRSDSNDGRDVLAARLRKLLAHLPAAPATSRQALRAEVRILAELLSGVRYLAKARLHKLTKATAARDRILAYFKLFVGEVIDGTELQVVGGIQEFARRIRELRVEFGYNISTGYSREDLRPDQYVLEADEPDHEAADKWATANKIRRQKGNARERALALFKAYLRKPITGEQIAYVSGIRETARRVRELRRDFGWRIVTKQTGRPDLPAGVYVLESEIQLPEHDRSIPDSTYDQVLERDKYKCRYCGWSLEDRNPAGRRQFLEVHHIVYHHLGGSHDPGNLVTLCNVHHDEVHKEKIMGADLKAWLSKSPARPR